MAVSLDLTKAHDKAYENSSVEDMWTPRPRLWPDWPKSTTSCFRAWASRPCATWVPSTSRSPVSSWPPRASRA